MTHDLLLILGITLLCMLSPGPDMVLVMHATLRGDRRAGLATSAGILTGNLVHIAYCALGVGISLPCGAASRAHAASWMGCSERCW